jgi:NADH dehydrogenase/NADH:ubiquinone oxidoreductase subunit G
MKNKIRLKINGKEYAANEGEYVLTVAAREGIDIPALCFNEAFEPYGACRLCLVEVLAGPYQPGLTTSCTLKVKEGLEVLTETEEIRKHRRVLLELYLAQAPESQFIKDLALKYDVTATRFRIKYDPADPLGNKCVLCGLCVRACNEALGIGAINYIGRGINTKVNTPFLEPSSECIGCNACVRVCPTGAIKFEDVQDQRIMISWSKTRVPLKQCMICGKYFAPEPLTLFSYQKMDPRLEEGLEDVCPDCRRKLFSRKEILASKGIEVRK